MSKSGTNLLAVWISGLFLALASGGCDQLGRPAPAPAPAAQPATPGAQPATPPAKKPVAKDVPLPADVVQFKAEINRAEAQVDGVVSRLDALAGASKDLEKPHEEFNASLKSLEEEAAGLKKRADDMRQRGAAYFEAWEKGLAAMTTPEVKDAGLKRKAELSSKYTELLTAMQETRASYDPFVAGLQELQKKLDDSLTVESIKALAPDVAKVKAGAKTLKDRIATVLEKVNTIGGIYAQS
jgi:chromosome segregation ATPase